MRKAAPTAEQIELKKHVRALEREVKRIIYRNRVPCRRYSFACHACGYFRYLFIEKPHVHSCPACGSDLRWERSGDGDI